jgi:hypothetical protein
MSNLATTGAVAPAPPAPDFPTDEAGGRLGWLHGARRIGALLPIFLGGEARFQCDGMRKAIVVDMAHIHGHVGPLHTPQEFLVLRPVEGEMVVSPWLAGGHAQLWATDELGVVAFRVPCIAAADGALLVLMPEVAVRYSRRSETRYLPPAAGDSLAGVTLLCGDAWRPCKLINLSASGLQVDAPADLALNPGSTVTLTLQLGGPRGIETTCEVRHRQSGDAGAARLGLQFTGINRLDRLCLERFLARHAAEAVVDRHTAQALPRLVLDALFTGQAENKSPIPPSANPPAAVLLTSRRKTQGQTEPTK